MRPVSAPSLRIKVWLTMLAFASLGLLATAAEQRIKVKIRPGERWWAGVITEAHRMPFTVASQFKFDFFANTAGNQGQPLLLSDQGRYVWCDEPFAFEFDRGVLRLNAPRGGLRTGTYGNTLAAVFTGVSQKFFPASGRRPDALLFTRPQFNTWIELTYHQNQTDVLSYARAVVREGYPPGVLMIDEGWERTYGDWDFNRERFPDPHAMMRELHQMGFKVMLWVCPYITPNGRVFREMWLQHTEKNFVPWIVNARNPTQPVLTEWWDGFSAVADLSAPDGQKWMNALLDFLVNTYGVDGFKFDGGDAEHYSAKNMLTPGRACKTNATPNEHSELYARLGLDYPLNEYRACWKLGGQALAQRLRDKEHSWTDLEKLIPGMLLLGIMGYPFSCPDMIGGGEYMSFRDLASVDQELVVRAAQCHALMPMMQFSVAPWRVLSPENHQLCVAMARLHADLGNEILALADAAARTGEPIVRSLEYQFPGRGYAEIKDQFLLGPTILVAPVLKRGATERTIHFPPGVWVGDDGSRVQGPSVHTVPAPLSRLPWYRLEQDKAK